MTVNIPKDSTFRGVPLKTVRDLLDAWRYGRRETLFSLAGRREIGLSPAKTMALLQEAEDAGFIGEEVHRGRRAFVGLTEAGLAIVNARAMKRTSKKKAQDILDGVIANAVAFNKNDAVKLDVDQIWVFGSMVDPTKADVGDIDIVVTEKRHWDRDVEKVDEWARGLMEASGLEYPVSAGFFFDEERYVTNRALFGTRKHALIARNALHTLIDLHRPCRLVFDRARG